MKDEAPCDRRELSDDIRRCQESERGGTRKQRSGMASRSRSTTKRARPATFVPAESSRDHAPPAHTPRPPPRHVVSGHHVPGVDGKRSGRAWRSPSGRHERPDCFFGVGPCFLSLAPRKGHGRCVLHPLRSCRPNFPGFPARVSARSGGGGGAAARCQEPRGLPRDGTWTAWISGMSIIRFTGQGEPF